MKESLEISDEDKLRLAMRVKKMIENNKGLLATDERSSTLEQRFTKYGIANTPENRIEFRDCMFTTREIEKYIGAVVLNEDTFGQHNKSGANVLDALVKRNIEIGVKMDKGLTDFKGGENICVGIEDFENRIKEERFSAATFCKWRSLFKVTDGLPTDACIEQNCIVLCKYALISQENGKVPIVEVEIGIDGSYTADQMALAAKKIYGMLFLQANKMSLFLPGLILKCSFITDGKMCPGEESDDVGDRNIRVLADSLPLSVGAVVFLSGGHSMERSFDFLSEIHKRNMYKDLFVSYSFCRALTDTVLEIWAGNSNNIQNAQEKFLEVVKKCAKANRMP